MSNADLIGGIGILIAAGAIQGGIGLPIFRLLLQEKSKRRGRWKTHFLSFGAIGFLGFCQGLLIVALLNGGGKPRWIAVPLLLLLVSTVAIVTLAVSRGRAS